MHPFGSGIYQLEKVESNFITNIYGKDRGFANYIERAAESGNVLYWNKSKSQELFMFQGLQLPEALNNFDFGIIIRQSQNIINTKTHKEKFWKNMESIHTLKRSARMEVLKPFEKKSELQEVTKEMMKKSGTEHYINTIGCMYKKIAFTKTN